MPEELTPEEFRKKEEEAVRTGRLPPPPPVKKVEPEPKPEPELPPEPEPEPVVEGEPPLPPDIEAEIAIHREATMPGAPPLTQPERQAIAGKIAPPPPPPKEPDLPEGAVLVEGIPSWIDPITDKPTPVQYKPVTVTTHTGERTEVAGVDIWKYSQLTGKEQFDKAIELGLINPDSKYVQDVAGKWLYIPKWEAHLEELRKEYLARIPGVRARAEARETLKKYRVNGTYDIALALKEGVTAPTILAAGFTSKAVNETRTWIKTHALLPDKNWIESKQLVDLKKTAPKIYEALTLVGFRAADVIIKRNETALDHLKDYTDRVGNIDGAKFLRDNPRNKTTLPNAGFTTEQIRQWQNSNISLMESLRGLSTVSRLSKTVWRFITPWKEEKGQTAAAYLRETTRWAKFPPTQAELKTEYEASTAQPAWARLLFPNNVMRMRDGTYVRVLMGVPPMVTPAGKLPAKEVQRIIKTIQINWNKFVPARKPKVSAETWARLTKAIERGTVKNADDATNWIKLHGTPPAPGLSRVQQVRDTEAAMDALKGAAAKRFLEQSREIAAAEAARVREAALQARQMIVFWTAALPGTLTYSKTVQRITELKRLTPSQALIQLSRDNATMWAAIAQPKTIAQMLTQVSTELRTKTLTELDIQMKELIEQATLTRQQEQQLTELQEQLETAVLTQTATQLAQQLQTKGLTQTQTATKVQTQTATETQTLTKAQVAQVTKTAVAQVVETPTIPPPVTPVTPSPPPRTPAPPKLPPPPPPLLLPRKKREEEERRKKLRQYPITWRQGLIWIVIKPPYRTKSDIRIMKRPPKGAEVAEGARSAYKTIQSLGGDAYRLELDVDAGIMDILIRQPRRRAGAKGAIRFRKDPHQKTKGDISLAGIRL